MTSAPVVFNYSLWQAQFPQFAYVTSAQAANYFALACLYCDNTPTSRIWDMTVRQTILYLLTCHWALLIGPTPSGAPASPLVGRISNATEGSVSVAAEMAGVPGSSAWFQQTAYGAAAWAALAPWRSFKYVGSRRGFPALGGFGWSN